MNRFAAIRRIHPVRLIVLVLIAIGGVAPFAAGPAPGGLLQIWGDYAFPALFVLIGIATIVDPAPPQHSDEIEDPGAVARWANSRAAGIVVGVIYLLFGGAMAWLKAAQIEAISWPGWVWPLLPAMMGVIVLVAAEWDPDSRYWQRGWGFALLGIAAVVAFIVFAGGGA